MFWTCIYGIAIVFACGIALCGLWALVEAFAADAAIETRELIQYDEPQPIDPRDLIVALKLTDEQRDKYYAALGTYIGSEQRAIALAHEISVPGNSVPGVRSQTLELEQFRIALRRKRRCHVPVYYRQAQSLIDFAVSCDLPALEHVLRLSLARHRDRERSRAHVV